MEGSMRLKDRVALITGGAAGIGKATAEKFLQEGTQVAIGDVDQEAGQAAVKELGPRAVCFQVDATDRVSIDHWINAVLTRYDRIDILINNAGIVRDSLLVKMKADELVKQMSGDDFDRVLAVNLIGFQNLRF
jgi:3-oxoacyl-[acyl-carrier protein] reductase